MNKTCNLKNLINAWNVVAESSQKISSKYGNSSCSGNELIWLPFNEEQPELLVSNACNEK